MIALSSVSCVDNQLSGHLPDAETFMTRLDLLEDIKVIILSERLLRFPIVMPIP